ncbi:unnamed protein product [Clavelina lepadiformis]|uniref:Uncharacterized protein n=1 Tax=Clavelina lepadiformis TaxID=159417 RepID=A0ABP0EZN0_CLALP
MKAVIAFSYFQDKRLEPVTGLKRHHQRHSSFQLRTKGGNLSALPSIGQHWHLFPYIIVDVPEKYPSCNKQYCHHIFQRLSLVCIIAVQTRGNQQRPSLVLWPLETGLLLGWGFFSHPLMNSIEAIFIHQLLEHTTCSSA